MPPLRRHQLVHLSAGGWSQVLEQPWDGDALACLREWASRRLPLVVTRQDTAEGAVALGLPAPLAWQRRRIALRVLPTAIAWVDEFPAAEKALPLLPRRARVALTALLARLGAPARVYGSHGWQLVTGLPYLHAHSDLDLWVAVDSVAQADAVAAHLAAHDASPRLDGELVFRDAAVAWREWLTWRSGRARGVLVKGLHRVEVAHCVQALAA